LVGVGDEAFGAVGFHALVVSVAESHDRLAGCLAVRLLGRTLRYRYERVFDHGHEDTMAPRCDSYPPWRCTCTTSTGSPPVVLRTVITICASSSPLQVQMIEPAAPSQPWKVYGSVGPAFVWSGS